MLCVFYIHKEAELNNKDTGLMSLLEVRETNRDIFHNSLVENNLNEF